MKNTMTVEVTKIMSLDLDGQSPDKLEVILFDENGESKKERAAYIEIKLNRNQSRDIEIEWE